MSPSHIRPENGRRLRVRRSPRSGFTSIEVIMLVALLLTGLLALTSTSLCVERLRRSDREQRLANESMRSIVDELRGVAFSMIDADPSWADAFTTAYAAGGNPGDTIAVPELGRFQGQFSLCTVTVITDETMTDAEIGVDLGMPRDLDNDGNVNNNDVSQTARMLPVVLQLNWIGFGGPRQLTQGFYVLGY